MWGPLTCVSRHVHADRLSLAQPSEQRVVRYSFGQNRQSATDTFALDVLHLHTEPLWTQTSRTNRSAAAADGARTSTITSKSVPNTGATRLMDSCSASGVRSLGGSVTRRLAFRYTSLSFTDPAEVRRNRSELASLGRLPPSRLPTTSRTTSGPTRGFCFRVVKESLPSAEGNIGWYPGFRPRSCKCLGRCWDYPRGICRAR